MRIVSMKNASITIDGEEFGAEVDGVNVNASSTDLTFTPISGDTVQEVGEPVYTLDLTFGQSLENTSLLAELFNRHGEKAEVVLRPNGGTTPTITADVTLKVPGTIGGSAGAVATSSVTLPVDGKPEIVFATA